MKERYEKPVLNIYEFSEEGVHCDVVIASTNQNNNSLDWDSF